MKSQSIETKIDIYTPEELSVEIRGLADSAQYAATTSYSPYSDFKVGAALLLADGSVFAASNQENAAYPSGLCAERVAMFYANAQQPLTPVTAIVIAAYTNGKFKETPITPCGACRQVLLETELRFGNEIDIYLWGTKEIYHIRGVRQLLPLCFAKESLS
ncbi:MAG: cytidine deaminase [Prevotellaceae bacterium]|jgi:cytidine deaminase|nr:cytidine deaminase [Prevotellaceae bacterium]